MAAARVSRIADAMPTLSVAVIVIIVGCVVALARSQIVQSGGITVLAVLHNGLGLAVGYGIAGHAGLDSVRCRTIAIEVGMQNSGLGAVLAVTHFAGNPLVGLPSAVFSVWHNISGPAVASYWSRRPPSRETVSTM